MKMGEQQGKDPGDDRAILRVLATWVDSSTDVVRSSGAPRCHVHRLPTGEWQLALAVQRGETRRQRHFISVDPDGIRQDRWALLKLAPTVWDIPVSIVFPGQFHGFVTLLGVPHPAPREAEEKSR